MTSAESALNIRPPLSTHFSSFEGYHLATPRLESGASAQTLRPLAPTPLQPPQHDYYGGDSSYLSAGVPLTPASTMDAAAGEPTPGIPSADATGTFPLPQGLNYSFDGGVRAAQQGSLQQHASVSGPSPGYQSWNEAYTPQQGHGRPSLTRASTSTSYNPVISPFVSQVPAGVIPSIPLPSEIPVSQFTAADDATSLTPTQIAAYDGQAFPFNHPFYSGPTPNIDRTSLEMTSNGESALSIPYQRLSNPVMVFH